MMAKAHHIQTSNGTILVCRTDGTLGHAPLDQSNINFTPVIACRPSQTADFCFLEAVATECRIFAPGIKNPARLLPLRQTAQSAGYFGLADMADAKALYLRELDSDGFGVAEFVAAVDSKPVLFWFCDAEVVDENSLVHRIEDGFSFDEAGFIALLDRADPEFWPLVGCFLQQLSVPAVRAIWSSAQRNKSHDVLLPQIYAHARPALPPYGSFTADVLSVFISQFGWSIGEKTYGSPLIFEPNLGRLTIGRYCSLADPRIILGNHFIDSATSYPFQTLWFEWPGTYVGLNDHVPRDVVIGNDVWIGAGSIILPGAIIADGAFVGAGSVVGGKIPPYSVCAGVPATVKHKRFDEKTIGRLLALQWWNWPDAVVERYIPLLLEPDIQKFLIAAEAEFAGNREMADL